MIWALKIISKVIFARLPVPYSFWRSMNLFRHGNMDSVEYAVKIFDLHAKRAFPEGLPPKAVILELGPGDSLTSALIGFGSGAATTYLVDVGPFAQKNISLYRAAAKKLSERFPLVSQLTATESFSSFLSDCKAEYLTEGLNSLQKIPTNSVDFVWSHSVLEHVRKDELESVLSEIRRILKQGGLASHNIDYQDHLDRSLNNLRFSEQVWESDLMCRSGFYTNRVPAIQLHQMFKNAGFEILHEEFGAWPELPIPRDSLHFDFQNFTDEELSNRTSHVLLRSA